MEMAKNMVTKKTSQTMDVNSVDAPQVLGNLESKQFENYFDEKFSQGIQQGNSLLQKSVANAFAATLGLLVLSTPLNFSVAYANENMANLNPIESVRSSNFAIPQVKLELSKANAYDQVPPHKFPSNVVPTTVPKTAVKETISPAAMSGPIAVSSSASASVSQGQMSLAD